MYHNFITKTDQLGVLKIMLMSNFNYPVFNEQYLVFNTLMEPSGIEPLTSCVQGRRSPSWAKAPISYRNKKEINLSKLNKVNSTNVFP